MSKQNIWKVYLHGRLINTAFYNKDCDQVYVRDSLINHDGMPNNIVVCREK